MQRGNQPWPGSISFLTLRFVCDILYMLRYKDKPIAITTLLMNVILGIGLINLPSGTLSAHRVIPDSQVRRQ